MDRSRFDDLARAVASPRPRRSLLRLAALALGAAGLADGAREAAAGCGQCRRKQRGKCRPKPAGTMCGDGTGKCFKGACRPEPDCSEAGVNCASAGDCCSGVCTQATTSCAAGGAGALCKSPFDCLSNNCVAYRCK